MNNVIVLPDGTQLKVEGDASKVTDCQHSFADLYEQRCYLFAALMRCFPKKAWKSFAHDDGSRHDGWFITGLTLPTGEMITYHMPESMFFVLSGIKELERAPKWDGHESKDTIARLDNWISL